MEASTQGSRELPDLVSPYYDFVTETEPQWVHQIRKVGSRLEMVSPFYNDITVAQALPQGLRSMEEAGGMSRFARSAAVVMLFSDERGKFVWLVRDAENDGGQCIPGWSCDMQSGWRLAGHRAERME